MKCTIRRIMICSQCIDNLENIDQFYTWKRSIDKEFYMPISDCPNYEYLEKNGYIISSEVSRTSMLVKPCKSTKLLTHNGMFNLYCVKPEEHEDQFYE